MFLVILGHTHLCEQQIVVKQAIYSFHMPLFFFLSGLLCKSTLSVRSLLKDARFLLLPYLFYGLLAIAAGVLFSGRLSAGDIAAGLGSLITGLDAAIGPIWFLPALFVCKQAGVLLLSVRQRSKAAYCLLAMLTPLPVCFLKDVNLPFFSDSALCGLPFFLLGSESARHLLGRSLPGKATLVCTGAFGAVLTVLIARENGMSALATCSYGASVPLYYAAALTGIVSATALCVAVQRPSRFVSTTASGNIVTLGTHGIILTLIHRIYARASGMDYAVYGLPAALLFTVLTYVGCYCVIVLAGRYCPRPFGLRG